MQFPSLANTLKISALTLALTLGLSACNDDDDNNQSNNNTIAPAVEKNFNRVASFLVCQQIDANCHTDEETAAEIVAASEDGNLLIYTDSPAKKVGFVDITHPQQPTAAGTIDLGNEPTSVAVKGHYALVGVNSSADFVNTSGELAVIDITTKAVVQTLNLGGQPDSVAVSPDGKFAAIVIENERDEDLASADGRPPQAPAGFLVIVDMNGAPSAWTTRQIALTSLADLFPDDPEPEYVDINSNNIAVITLQENNYIILVDLVTGAITNHFSAGGSDLTQVDAQESKPAIIQMTDNLTAIPREPDGVTWLSNDYFATADEGDMDGGSRTFTVFDTQGNVVFSPTNALEHQVVRMGHYPDKRSENKGNEPENAEYGQFGDHNYLFVASERSSVIFVYDVNDPANPVLKQTLPAGVGPEGVLAIPSRNLMIAASEKDDRGAKMRSVLNIYHYAEGAANYPTLVSANDANGAPIPWGALSGLAADPANANTLYSIEDSFYQKNRIFKIDTSTKPATITQAIQISDAGNVFANMATSTNTSVDDKDIFSAADLAKMINADNTVNIDPEGIAVATDGGFWVASEGSGTIGDTDSRPINSYSLLFKTDPNGVIEQVVTLPDEINAKQLRFGFEGVAQYGTNVYVAFQRAWKDDSTPRIGIYDTVAKTWQFVFYPLDAVESQNGGWVGLSDITSLGNGQFLVLERDNQGGPDAAIKRIYRIDLTSVQADAVIEKTLVRDLMADLKAPNGLVYEKVEGLAVDADGNAFIVNDNDGVDDNSGETQLMNLGKI
jgi:hypothetical protein